MLLIKAAGINDTNTEGRPASRNEKCPRAAKAMVTTEIVTLVNAPETRTPKLVVKQILPGFPVNAPRSGVQKETSSALEYPIRTPTASPDMSKNEFAEINKVGDNRVSAKK